MRRGRGMASSCWHHYRLRLCRRGGSWEWNGVGNGLFVLASLEAEDV